MKKILSIFLFLASFMIAVPAKAICPICTVAVGAGVGILRHYGVDDTITGIWVGGLTVSLSLWTLSWLKRKKYDFYLKEFIVFAAYYLTTFGTLYYLKYLGHPLNKLLGIDKLNLGIIIGSIVFFASAMLYFKLKKMNGGHAHFPFEKIAITISGLAISSLIFYFITRK